jgi:hypothetical protein
MSEESEYETIDLRVDLLKYVIMKKPLFEFTTDKSREVSIYPSNSANAGFFGSKKRCYSFGLVDLNHTPPVKSQDYMIKSFVSGSSLS